jgi:kynurenine formamidase
MKLIDLSQPLHENAPGSPAYPTVTVEEFTGKHRERWNIELVTLPSHIGTHIDAPKHKLKHWKGLEDFPLDQFRGKAVLADFRGSSHGQRFGPADLKRKLPKYLDKRIVLIATGWAFKREQKAAWNKGIPHLSPDGAHWLVEQGIRAVGIDHWSIGGPDEPYDSLTHTILMSDNVWIVENMQFPDPVFELPRPFEFWCLPVNIPKLSGVLCRPVAVVKESRSKRGASP